MGLTDSLKQFYTGIEESYYNFCDYLQQNVNIPIYDWFVTPIESRGIPSFPFFLALILLIVGGGLFAFSVLTSGTTSVTVLVTSGGNPIADVPVVLMVSGSEFGTANSNSVGEAVFQKVPVGKPGRIIIDKAGYEEFEWTFSTAKGGAKITAALKSSGGGGGGEEKVRITLKVTDGNGIPLGGASVSYIDSETGDYTTDSTDASGTAILTAENKDSQLGVTVTKSGYQKGITTVYASSDTTKTIALIKEDVIDPSVEPPNPRKGEVLVSVADEEGMPVDALVQLIHDETDAPIDSGRTFSEGKVAFSSVDAVGSRLYVVVNPRDESLLPYDGSSEAAVLRSSEPLEFRVTLTAKIPGEDYNITLIVKERDAGPLEGAIAMFYNQETNAPLGAQFTDIDGMALLETDKTVYAAIRMEEYLPELALDLVAGDKRTVELQKINEDNSAQVKAFVLDADGNLVEGAKVNILTDDGFFIGYETQNSHEDGTTTFADVPLELRGGEAKYILKASAHGVSGTSSSFILQAAETKEVVVRLDRQMGTAIIKLKDITSQKPILNGSVVAYTREDGVKIDKAECRISNSSCEIRVPANKAIYFKVASEGYLPLETEDFSVQFGEIKELEASLIPSNLKTELAAFFEGISSDDSGGAFTKNYPSLVRGGFYSAKFVLNIPAGSEKAGLFIKVSGSDGQNADEDIAAIANFEKPGNAVITKGFTYSPSGDCKKDSGATEDASNKLVKWLNYEYASQQGTKAVVVRVFVKPEAKSGDEVNFAFRGYAMKGKIWTRTPEDGDLGNEEKTKEKDSCYAETNGTSIKVSEDRLVCKSSVCYSLQFAGADGKRASRGFASPIGVPFNTLFAARLLKGFDSPYITITDDKELEYYRYTFAGESGDAAGKGEATFPLDSVAIGKTAAGQMETRSYTASAFSKVNFELGDSNGPIIKYATSVSITGTAEFVMSVSPTELQANEDARITVTLVNALDGEPVTDAIISIEEDEGAAFDGNTPESIVGGNKDGAGLEGKYVFKKIHPFNTGKFIVIAKRQGFVPSEKEVKVSLNEFLEASTTSLSLTCDGGEIELSNLLNSEVNVLGYSACLQLMGDGITELNGGEGATFSLKAKGSKTITLNPSKQGTVACKLNFDAIAGSAHANIGIPTRVECQRLDKACTGDPQCPPGQYCDFDAGRICKDRIIPPLECTNDGNCTAGAKCDLATNKCVPRDGGSAFDPNAACADKTIQSVYKCSNNDFRIRFKGLGGASEFYFENGTLHASCPLNPTVWGSDCTALMSISCQQAYCDKQACETNEECQSGELCILGACEKPTENAQLKNPLEIKLDENLRYHDFFSLTSLLGNSTLVDCEIRSNEEDTGQRIDRFVSVTCDAQAKTIEIEADYSQHAYYDSGGKDAIPRNFYTDMSTPDKKIIGEIQTGILYLSRENKADVKVNTKVMGPSITARATNNTILITENGFEPSELYAQPGAKITWINLDSTTHSVKSISGVFSKDYIKPGQSFSFNFSNNGTYNYRDDSRLNVKGVIYIGNQDAECKYKNLNYFAQRFVGHLAKGITRYFDPNAGKSMQTAFSSAYKFYVTPAGIRSGVGYGLMPPGVYGWNANPMGQQFNPMDQRAIQFGTQWQQQFPGSTSTFSGANDPQFCTPDGGSGFICNIELSPLLPMNGAAFTIVNDYALLSASTSQLLVSRNTDTSYLVGQDVDKAGVFGKVVGVMQNAQELLLSAPRFTTFILTNDPTKVVYYYDEEAGQLKMKFARTSSTKDSALSNDDTVLTQTFTAVWQGGGYQALSIKFIFTINNDMGKYGIVKIPASGEAFARLVETGEAKEEETDAASAEKYTIEPFYVINNIPASKLSVVDSATKPERGEKALKEITYFQPKLKESEETLLADLTLKLKKKSALDKIGLPLPKLTLSAGGTVGDVIGNVGTDSTEAASDEEGNTEVFKCSGNNFCDKEAYGAAEQAVGDDIASRRGKLAVQRIDFSGFGDYAAQRLAEALALTLADYAADKAQFKACGGAKGFLDVCSGRIAGSSNYDCAPGEACDNSITGGEFWALNKEQFALAACDSEVVSNYEAIFAQKDWDRLKALAMRKLLGNPDFMPRVQNTKPIVSVGNMAIRMIFKRAADSNGASYVLKYYPLFGSEYYNLDGLYSVEKWLSMNSDENVESGIGDILTNSEPTGTNPGKFKPIGNKNPIYFYLDQEEPDSEIKIEMDDGKANLFTMNKYPIILDPKKDKTGIFKAAFLKVDPKPYIEWKKESKKKITVESCFLDFTSSGTETKVNEESAFPDTCSKSDMDKAKGYASDVKITSGFSVILLEDGTKLKIMVANRKLEATTNEAGGTVYLPSSFLESSRKDLGFALRYLFDETYSGSEGSQISLGNMKFKDEKVVVIQPGMVSLAPAPATGTGTGTGTGGTTAPRDPIGGECYDSTNKQVCTGICRDDDLPDGIFTAKECDTDCTIMTVQKLVAYANSYTTEDAASWNALCGTGGTGTGGTPAGGGTTAQPTKRPNWLVTCPAGTENAGSTFRCEDTGGVIGTFEKSECNPESTWTYANNLSPSAAIEELCPPAAP